MQGRILRVADVPKIFRHNPVKDIVNASQNRISASEVLMKLDFQIRSVFPRFRRVGMIFLQKQLRSGQAEPINALFYITHHKHIVLAKALSGYRF